MKPGRIFALVIGCLLILPALAMLLAGGALGVAYSFQREDGYFDVTLDRLETTTVAITAEDIDLLTDPGTPGWVVDFLDADVRLRVTGADTAKDVFIGIGPENQVDAYLSNVAHTEISEVDGRTPQYRERAGGSEIEPPTQQTFWSASEDGAGTQELLWEASSGRWAAVLMNADGSPGVAADTRVGIKADFVLPLAIILGSVGAVLTVLASGLILTGANGLLRKEPDRDDQPMDPYAQGEPLGWQPQLEFATHPPYPLQITAQLDPGLSRWQWLVKWFLAIPHFIILAILWVAFAVLTVVAGISILFTGRYPRGIFDFNVGILRWSWRVNYYAASGGIGTDQYPPFSLDPDPNYPAQLSVTYPPQLSRGLVLIKWWLLILPHYLIVGLLVGGSFRWLGGNADRFRFDLTQGGGLLGLLVLITGVVLLVTGSYPRQLFNLIVGLNRWVYRVIAYAALMTDEYPPFRLDQGGSEPISDPSQPGPSDGAPGSQVDLRPGDAAKPTDSAKPADPVKPTADLGGGIG